MTTIAETSKVTLARRIKVALGIAVTFGAMPGAHQKAWVIDSMARALLDEFDYSKFVAEACDGPDGPNTYQWDCGIAP